MPTKEIRHTPPCAHHKSRCRKSKVKFSKHNTRPAVCPPWHKGEPQQNTKAMLPPFRIPTANTNGAQRETPRGKQHARKPCATLFLETTTHAHPLTGSSPPDCGRHDKQQRKPTHPLHEHGALRHHNNGAPPQRPPRPERPERTTKVPICGVVNSYFFGKTMQR